MTANSSCSRRRAAWRGTLPAALLLLGSTGVACAAEVSIAPSVAALFVGQEKVVEGTVTGARRDGNTVRLRLGTAPADLGVSLVLGLLSRFPPAPQHYYLGKTVRVIGTIRSFRNAIEMTIDDPAHILVVEATMSRPPAAADPGPATLQQRLDAMDRRLRRLEQEVRELRGSAPR